jgi:serine protease Do
MNDGFKKAMEQKIIIRHLSGSKVNQTNVFPNSSFKELSIGRDEGVDIQYDSVKDDLVSRQHAIIFREDGNRFMIKDEKSRNGTFVNKQRISGTSAISHNDIVQFGPGGPEFRFELNPPPKSVPPPTREASTYRPSKPTREISSAGTPAGYRVAEKPVSYTQKGRFTLLHESFSAYKEKNLRTQICIASGLLGLVIFIGGLAYSLIAKSEQKTGIIIEKVTQNQYEEMQYLGKTVNEIAEETILRMSPQAIGKNFSNAVVKINLDWRLTNIETNQSVYHRMQGNGTIPTYLDIDGRIIPWLTTNPEKNTNTLIGGSFAGTGFSVSRQGLILTNRHLAAGGTSAWGVRPYMRTKGHIYRAEIDEDSKEKIVYKVIYAPIEVMGDRLKLLLSNMNSWIPSGEQILVEDMGGNNFIVTKSQLISRDTIDIFFPGDPNAMSGRLARKSIHHDVALITVDSAGALPELILEESGKEPVLGEPITILGYPGISENLRGITRTSNAFDQELISIRLYNPTLTTGHMGGRVNPNIVPSDSTSERVYALMDYYQLTANANGTGNNGAPVFNSHGRVTGIFFAGADSGAAMINMAIPIKYGKELIKGYKPIK